MDGKKQQSDGVLLVEEIEIDVVNHIMNPTKSVNIDNRIVINELLCIEMVHYSIQRNNIQVSVKYEFKNETPVKVQLYYGMQSMFDKETHTLTPNGKYVDWTPQAAISTFDKKGYPNFHRFIEKKTAAYQSSYLFDEGLGSHTDITDNDAIFIGNSSAKTYHKIIANKSYKKGDLIHWSGVYTWFRSPIIDDDDILCYEGIIDHRKVLFIDCKKSIDRRLQLPDYINKAFMIREKSSQLTIIGNKIPTTGLRMISKGSGSCVITF